jgi:hypothetical protein
MARFVQCGLSIAPAQHQRIKRLAAERGKHQADMIRHLIDLALPLAEAGHGLDLPRLVTILEFTSLALDTLVQRASPGDADRLLDLAIEHAKTYHGA